ncbi:MAG: hypothetical protein V1769_03350, partial [Thermoplasmatota archaeon]
PGSGKFTIRTYNTSLSIDNGRGAWERSYLTKADITPIISSPRSPTNVQSLTLVHHDLKGITFLVNNVLHTSNVLKIYNALGSCMYETLVQNPQAAIHWENQQTVPAGNYFVSLVEQSGERRSETHSFSIVK